MDGIPLLDQLKNLRDEPDFRRRRALSQRIVETIGEYHQDMLRLLKEEPDKTIKIQALDIIAASQDQSFAPAVRQVLLSQEQPVEVLQTAATVLGKLRSQSSFPTLIHLLKHDNPNVRLGAIYGLVALGNKQAVPHLLNSLDEKDRVKPWWPSPKAGGYTVGQEASVAIDALTGFSFRGDKTKIEEWINDNLNRS
jgi:HEAT repeat protein